MESNCARKEVIILFIVEEGGGGDMKVRGYGYDALNLTELN